MIWRKLKKNKTNRVSEERKKEKEDKLQEKQKTARKVETECQNLNLVKKVKVKVKG